MRNPFLTGKKVYLRGIEEGDLIGNMALWANDEEVTHFLVMGAVPNSGPIYCSWDSPREEYERLRRSDDIVFAIIEKRTDAMIGVTGLYEISWIPRKAELRIIIGEKEHWGKGYGMEATQLLLGFAFDKLNLSKVYLGVNAEHEPALRLYKGVGFVEEGRLRMEQYRNGRYYDVIRLSILRDDYYKRTSPDRGIDGKGLQGRRHRVR